MNKRKTLALLAAAAAGGDVHAQGTFTGLGDLPAGQIYSTASAISDDGLVAAGQSSGVVAQVVSNHAVRWTREAGLVPIALAPPYSLGSYGVSISRDGGVMAGNAFIGPVSTRPFVWTASGVTLLGTSYSSIGKAAAVSADGTTVVGQGYFSLDTLEQGARWTIAGDVIPLGYLPDTNRCDAAVVSRDGSVVYGSCYANGGTGNNVYRWTMQTGIQPLDVRPAGSPGWFPNAGSEDGSVVCGTVIIGTPTTFNRSSMFRWTQESGTTLLDPDPSHPQSAPRAMSADGKAIVGQQWTNTTFRAAVWTSETGLQGLQDYLLTRHGFALPSGWTLESANGISADKRNIVGSGKNANGQSEGWIITLPWPLGCYANCDESTAAPKLNANDFQCFLNRFAAGDSIANCDGSTAQPTLNVNDFQCFLNAFAAGCT